MFDENISLRNEGLNIEAVVSYPEKGNCCKSAVIFPPHPKLGGDMENNVVKAISETFISGNFITGRYNYRGVGKSETETPGATLFDYWNYIDEKGDIEKIVSDARFVVSQIIGISGAKDITLAGYSFGAKIAAELSSDDYVSRLILISPPLSFYDYSCLAKFKKEILFIIAEKDICVTEDELKALIKKYQLRGTLKTVPAEDHFYRDSENKIRDIIEEFISS